MNYFQILNREDLGSVSLTPWDHNFMEVRNGRCAYRMAWCNVHCYTSQCTNTWVIKGFICNSTADDCKAIRILRNNVPVNRIIKHAIASRMHHGYSLEEINNLRAVLRSLK